MINDLLFMIYDLLFVIIYVLLLVVLYWYQLNILTKKIELDFP